MQHTPCEIKFQNAHPRHSPNAPAHLHLILRTKLEGYTAAKLHGLTPSTAAWVSIVGVCLRSKGARRHREGRDTHSVDFPRHRANVAAFPRLPSTLAAMANATTETQAAVGGGEAVELRSRVTPDALASRRDAPA